MGATKQIKLLKKLARETRAKQVGVILRTKINPRAIDLTDEQAYGPNTCEFVVYMFYTVDKANKVTGSQIKVKRLIKV